MHAICVSYGIMTRFDDDMLDLTARFSGKSAADRAYFLLKYFYEAVQAAEESGDPMSDSLSDMFHEWMDDPRNAPAIAAALDRLIVEAEQELCAFELPDDPPACTHALID